MTNPLKHVQEVEAFSEAYHVVRTAVVVMDAQTGAVLAMVSTPYFDPNRILAPDYVSELDQ